MLEIINLDPQIMLETLKNPLTGGLQLLAALLVVNVMLGVLAARKAGTFNRAFLLKFAESRLLYQMFPAAACGLAAEYFGLPLFFAVYWTVGIFMLYDLLTDIKEKAKTLWTRK